ncbi:hypothetical protein AB0M20_14570 [Actinoplanes sp. NPDC051633]|uniref:hypothetical protein n=1 Tax=Actinoplanes sp. NPDC051633 TaxID=3155670 RepID=UPI003431DDEB
MADAMVVPWDAAGVWTSDDGVRTVTTMVGHFSVRGVVEKVDQVKDVLEMPLKSAAR